MNYRDNLELNEKLSIIIETGLQLIPYVGSPMATAYFSTKQTKQYKRLEQFYFELSKEVELLGKKVKEFDIQYEDGLISIIEKINYIIEREHQQQKINCYKNYIKETLINPVTSRNYDKRVVFLDILNKMSVLECEILSLLYKDNKSNINCCDIKIDGVSKYQLIGALTRLQSYGVVTVMHKSFSFSGASGIRLEDSINKNYYGDEFIKFILQENVSS